MTSPCQTARSGFAFWTCPTAADAGGAWTQGKVLFVLRGDLGIEHNNNAYFASAIPLFFL